MLFKRNMSEIHMFTNLQLLQNSLINEKWKINKKYMIEIITKP